MPHTEHSTINGAHLWPMTTTVQHGRLHIAGCDLAELAGRYGTPLYLLLDDIAGSTLIAGFAWSRTGVDWRERARRAGVDFTDADKFRANMENICSGFRTGSSSLTMESGSGHNVAAVPPLGDVTDPWSWHELVPHPEVAMQRARRIDVWHDGGDIGIDAMFRDSCWTPDGTEVATAALPLEFDGRKVGKRLDPQPVGAQTREVLRGMGLDEQRIDALLRQGVVAA